MKIIEKDLCREVVGGEWNPGVGMDAAGCRSDVVGGFGVGATVGGSIGLAAGAPGAAVGAMVGGLAGGAVAASESPACGGGGGSSSSRVICTHLFRKGLLDERVWRADMEFTFKHLSSITVRGYHAWAIPYVRLMRKFQLAEKVIRPLAVWRAEELAYKMGVLPKGNWKGKFVRLVGEPICFMVGVFSSQQNWESLWVEKKKNTEAASNI